MPANVTLRIVEGPQEGREFLFSGRALCVVGRAEGCEVLIDERREQRIVSRHHCLFDMNPPHARVRDFASLNGTLLNGRCIGKRGAGLSPEEGRARGQFEDHELHDGDEIRLGKTGTTVLRVAISVPAQCGDCGREIADEDAARALVSPGTYRCDECRERARRGERADRRASGSACARCGRPLLEAGAGIGEMVCESCRGDLGPQIREVLERGSEVPELRWISGYRVVEELKSGAMGAVYLARPVDGGEPVALKVMLPQLAVTERGKDLFRREIENTRALRHPNIVEFRDDGCWQGTFFLILEYCDGGSVWDLLGARGGTLPVEEAVAICLQALEGLEFARDAIVPNVRLADGNVEAGRGVVHRDIKPGNILLKGSGPDRVAKIGDFGISKAFDKAGLTKETQTGMAGGTPRYAAREQFENYRYAGPEVDVWSLAACLYFMLTGAVPRDFPAGEDPVLVVLERNAVPIRQRSRHVPAPLAEVIDHALTEDPIGFKTAGELQRALERAL